MWRDRDRPLTTAAFPYIAYFIQPLFDNREGDRLPFRILWRHHYLTGTR